MDGFYDPLLSFIDMAVNEGFIKEDARRIIISAPTAKELVLKLEVWKLKPEIPIPIPKRLLSQVGDAYVD